MGWVVGSWELPGPMDWFTSGAVIKFNGSASGATHSVKNVKLYGAQIVSIVAFKRSHTK